MMGRCPDVSVHGARGRRECMPPASADRDHELCTDRGDAGGGR